jgi:DNA-binding NarL/FixJ family response regulator
MKVRVLIADDKDEIRAAFKDLLATTEMEVVAEACSGEAAVQAAMENDVDLVVLDVRMPDGDGFWALESIKAREPTLPCVMHTVENRDTCIARCHPFQADGYLAKGSDEETILSVLRSAVGRGY